MSHSYVGLEEFKAFGAANVTRTEGDERILEDLETASRQLERLLNGRWFFPKTETKYFSGNGKTRIEFPAWDILSVTTLKEDTNLDSVYETTWATTDYLLEPNDHSPTDATDPRPYWILDVDERSTGNQDQWLKGQRMYELVGTFGYCNLTIDTGATINEGAEWSSSDTNLIVTPQTGLIDVGNTLLIESEQVYVTQRSGNDYTVRRGMNGTTAASHADSTAISRYIYPENVVKAVILQVSRLRIRNVSGFAQQVGFDQTGAFPPQVGVDQDYWQLVDRYKRMGVY